MAVDHFGFRMRRWLAQRGVDWRFPAAVALMVIWGVWAMSTGRLVGQDYPVAFVLHLLCGLGVMPLTLALIVKD